ncbi:unnamed protein product [Closterium sp. Naga37s-1]|nr:unnamed protein product [Closterium sp. Naga37s-1]
MARRFDRSGLIVFLTAIYVCSSLSSPSLASSADYANQASPSLFPAPSRRPAVPPPRLPLPFPLDSVPPTDTWKESKPLLPLSGQARNATVRSDVTSFFRVPSTCGDASGAAGGGEGRGAGAAAGWNTGVGGSGGDARWYVNVEIWGLFAPGNDTSVFYLPMLMVNSAGEVPTVLVTNTLQYRLDDHTSIDYPSKSAHRFYPMPEIRMPANPNTSFPTSLPTALPASLPRVIAVLSVLPPISSHHPILLTSSHVFLPMFSFPCFPSHVFLPMFSFPCFPSHVFLPMFSFPCFPSHVFLPMFSFPCFPSHVFLPMFSFPCFPSHVFLPMFSFPCFPSHVFLPMFSFPCFPSHVFLPMFSFPCFPSHVFLPMFSFPCFPSHVFLPMFSFPCFPSHVFLPMFSFPCFPSHVFLPAFSPGADFRSGQPYQIVSVPQDDLVKNGSVNTTELIVGIFSDSYIAEGQDLGFSIRAFCSQGRGCPLNCSGRGVCGQGGVCQCPEGWGGTACADGETRVGVGDAGREGCVRAGGRVPVPRGFRPSVPWGIHAGREGCVWAGRGLCAGGGSEPVPRGGAACVDGETLGKGGGIAEAAVVHDIQPGLQTLAPGQWAFFQIQVTQPHTKLLIQMERAAGDLVLFAKRQEQGFLPFGMPTVFDFNGFADMDSFRQRLDRHQIVWNRTKPGIVLVAVLNNDVDLRETGGFRLEYRLAVGREGRALCPWDCGWPAGFCQAMVPEGGGNGGADGGDGSAETQCVCNPDSAGSFCQGGLQTAELGKAVSGVLPPGRWTYMQFTFNPTTNKQIVISFTRKGGQASLVARQGAVPSLLENDYRFTVRVTNDTLVSLFDVVNSSLEGPYTFGIFNLNYYVHQSCEFELEFKYKDSSSFFDSPYIIIIYAVVAFLLLVLIVIVLRCVIRRPPPAAADVELSAIGDMDRHVEAAPTGVDRALVESFPLVKFRDDLFESSDDAHCAVCLADYDEQESLRKLPACSHYFHVSCIGEWLRTRCSCPLCRRYVLLQPPQPQQPEQTEQQQNPSQIEQAGQPTQPTQLELNNRSCAEDQSGHLLPTPLGQSIERCEEVRSEHEEEERVAVQGHGMAQVGIEGGEVIEGAGEDCGVPHLQQERQELQEEQHRQQLQEQGEGERDGQWHEEERLMKREGEEQMKLEECEGENDIICNPEPALEGLLDRDGRQQGERHGEDHAELAEHACISRIP